MRFTETALAGAFVVDLERFEDERGFFARTFCEAEFAAQGLKPVVVQTNLSFTKKAGTLRGMHFQYPPAGETKLVRCLRGAVLDVIVDLRPESPTFLKHAAVELNEETLRAIYVPERFAHGHQSLTGDTLLSYHMGAVYDPASEGGLRYDDPALGISWPRPIAEISRKDQAFAPFTAIEGSLRTRMAAVPGGGNEGSCRQ